MLLITLALIAVSTAEEDQVNPDLVYKYVDAYQLIWRDAGSDAHVSGSVWRALNYQSEFCALGDVAVEGWDMPADKAVFVSERKPGVLVHPTRFTRVWNDQGSDSASDVTIYKMHAPPGYTCLGGVAVNSYRTKPDPEKYCCVQNEYVVQADTVHTWNDRGSGASLSVSLWTVIRAGGEALGINAGTFAGVRGYTRPEKVFLLKADGYKVRDIWNLPTGQDKALNLHGVGEMKLIWNDQGAGATQSVSIWRAEGREGYYSPGDIAINSYNKPRIGFLLRPTDKNSDQIRAPVSYRKIWNDRGSGASMNVQLWSVNCPAGYVSLGSVATSGAKPALGNVWCVNSTYTSFGTRANWRKVWVDQGSEAAGDVTIFEAKPTGKSQQSVRGFGAVPNYSYKPNPPYFLNKNSVQYWAEKPIEKMYMYNVKYKLSKEKQMTSPVKMSPTEVVNRGPHAQTSTRVITYSWTRSSSYTFNEAIQLGIAMEITAGTPLIGAAQKTTISASFTSSSTSGSSNTTTESDQIRATLTVPGKSMQTAVVTATQYKADIPYTATIKKVYFDGSENFADVTGVYKGVAISAVKVDYSDVEPLPDELMTV